MAGKKGVVLREFCAENLERVPSALDAGAGRIELCDNLAVGGTTPSLGVIEAAVDLCHARGARVMCMIRPRGGGFEYSPAEAEIMARDLSCAAEAGVDGAVFGCLRDGGLDRPLMGRLVEQAHAAGLEVTMHMAFDELDAVAQRVAIEELAALGVERVLTHGGSAGVPIEKTLPHLKEIVSWANGRLTVLPGGGVTYKNAELVAGELGVSEVHGTRVVPLG